MISEAAILFRYYSNKVPLIPIPDFYNPNFIQRGRVKRVIDKNHKLHSGGTPAFFSNYGAFNFPILDDNQFFSELYDKFVIKSTELFGEFTLASDNSSTCWASRYNKKMGKRQDSWWHNQAHTSTINAIYYLDIFNDGISFRGLNNEIYDYLPKNNELIILPSTLIHAVQSSTLRKYRYAVNMEIKTEESVTDLFSKVFKYGFS